MKAPERGVRPPFAGRRVVLGVTGGIAAYKSIALARELTLAGASVDVVLTSAALEFVRPLSFEALTGRAVHYDMYAPGDPLLHIRLAREADLVAVAPATANLIARAATGMADDLLSAILLATSAPIIVCPAMNDRMYAHPRTQANVAELTRLGYEVFGPADGALAWGEGSGRGRMEEPERILDEVARMLTPTSPLSGRRVLVTAGPTREDVDPVRFIGNRSSGRMGYALAETARRYGADVTLITGPTALSTPTGIVRIDVESAAEMHDAVARELPEADVLVMAAAIADFRPVGAAPEKIKKEAAMAAPIELERTADVLLATRELRKPGAIVVGFALETENAVENGRRKLTAKGLDIVVVNNAREAGAAFEVDTNRVTIIDRSGTSEDLPLLSKDEVADRIFHRIFDLITADR